MHRPFLFIALSALATIAIMAMGNTTASSYASFNDSSTGSAVEVTAGEWLATLTIVKVTTPATSTTTFPFTTSPSITGCASFDLDTDPGTGGTLSQRVCSNVPAGTYTVDEAVPANWTVSDIDCVGNSNQETGVSLANGTFTVELEGGEDVTCTITNIQSVGTITIVKATNPAASTQTFDFIDDIPSCTIGTLDTNPSATNPSTRTCNSVPVGTYAVDEAVPTDWFVSSIDCVEIGGTSNSTVVLSTGIATIRLEANESVTCTFNNQGPITVELGTNHDSWVDNTIGQQNTNHGTSTVMDSASIVGLIQHRSLFSFDLSSIPTTATVMAAELHLCNTTILSVNLDYDVQRITEAWLESTVTWNNQPAVTGATGLNISLALDLSPPECYDINIGTTQVQSWVTTPSGNHGLRIDIDVLGLGTLLATKENANAALRPGITVTYKLAAP